MPKKGVCLGMLAGGNSKIFGLFSCRNIGEMESNLTEYVIFFKWIGSTTN